MKILALAFLPFALLACGDDADPVNNQALIHIQDCIANGGDPQYTTNSYGNVVDFLGCQK